MTQLMEDTKMDTNNDRDRSTHSTTDANTAVRKSRWLPYDLDESSLDIGIDHNGDDDDDDDKNVNDDISRAHWNL